MTKKKYHSFAVISLSLLIVASLTLLAFDLPRPFTGENTWRNAQTFSVARNLLEEEFNVFQPRYDLRGVTDGRFPGEFPLLGAITAVTMKFFGTSIFVAKMVSYLIFISNAVLVFFLLRKLTGSQFTALIAASLFASHNIMASQGVAIMPEVLCNFMATASIFAYFFISNRQVRFFTTLCLLTLAALVKPPGFFAFAFLWPFMFVSGEKHRFLHMALFALVPFVVLLLWKNYTMQFEHPTYIVPKYLTHHYYRTVEMAWNEFHSVNIKAAFDKVFEQGFSYAGKLTFVGFGFVYMKKAVKLWTGNSFTDLFKKTEPVVVKIILKGFSYTAKLKLVGFFIVGLKGFFKLRPVTSLNEISKKADLVIVGLLGWIIVNLLFLFYAGDAQRVQYYYAAPVSLPCVLLVAVLLKRLHPVLVVMLCIIPVITLWDRLEAYCYSTAPRWDDVRLERITDEFSTRDDIFLAFPSVPDEYGYSGMDFTTIGRLGRKGSNVYNLEQFKAMKNSGFNYLYVHDDFLKEDLRALLHREPYYKSGKHNFYKLR